MEKKEKGMQKKMYIVIAAVAVVAIATLALILAAGRKEETYRSIKIIELEGGVTIEREGVGVLAASSNMNLISGDAVKTEQDAYAVLQLDSDKYVMLAESGSMTVVAEGDEANSRTSIQLDSGSVLNEIQNPLSSGSSYDIVTPNATMSVRGTVFEVRKGADGIEVLVYDGKVAVGLDGMEPALYEAGEYTQFTADENPRFIVERTEITEEHLNPQFMDRLEQINSQSRELNLGTAQLASAQTQDEASEPRQTPAVSEPTATPTPAPAATPEPSPSPAAVQTPVSTPKPEASIVTAPVATEAPVVESPAVEDEDQDDEDDDQNETDNSESAQQPGESSGNGGNAGANHGNNGNNGEHQGNGSGNIYDTQNFWKNYTFADYEKAVGNSVDGAECTVIYYMPEMAAEADGCSQLKNASPGVYASVQVKVGETLKEPESSGNVPDELSGLSVTWCLEDGTPWDFEKGVVKANMCLYPVWGDELNKIYYYPVICRSGTQNFYYCNIVKAGSCLKEDNSHDGYSWKWMNGEAEWKLGVDGDTVDGVLSLKASWSSN